MVTEDKVGRIPQLSQKLDEAGYSNFLVLSSSDYRDLLTPRRTELMRTVSETEGLSVTELAEVLERDEGAVSRDLSTLYEFNVVDFERDGSRKIPVMKFQTIFSQPLEFGDSDER